MDVKEGFCWRCNKALHNSPVMCSSCGTAEYCSTKCRGNDQLRHKSVECPLWSAKICGNCRKVGATNECSGCYSVWYCNKECQVRDWPIHKPVCRKWQKIVKQVASRPLTCMGDYPFYFSNSFSNDLLNLQNNEMKDDTSVQSHFNILLPACGDLRHVMKTVQSLPETFSSRLKFVLNDIDPFPMARNVLLLFMMSCCEAEQSSNISTVWLSLQLPHEDYLLLQEMLSKLIQMDCTDLKKITGGGIDINEHSYNVIREVWQGWAKYPCNIENENRSSIFRKIREVWQGWSKYPCNIENENRSSIFRERNAIFHSDPMASIGLEGHLHDIPEQHVPSIKKWFGDGLILPGDNLDVEVTHYNPTFTGRGKQPIFFATIMSPSSYNFTYSVRSDCIPYQMWDYLDMVQFKLLDSVIAMCHAFNTHVVSMTRMMMRDRRLSFYVSTVDFLDLGSVIHEEAFDRIFPSNLIDYYRISQVLEVLEPFLSKTNPHATLFTETFNWFAGLDSAVWPTDQAKQVELTMRGLQDCNLPMSDMFVRQISCSHEYYDNTAYFINYLRGEKLVNHKEKLPRLSAVTNRRGLTMRDFRKRRNHVIPFNQRVAVRTVNMLNGDVRTMEWYRKLSI